MASETEPAKLLLPYLQRADELQKHEPLVAYYCRLYAMERGLKIPQSERTKTTNALLVSLMKQLEKDKKSLKLAPEDNLYLEGFASSVFAKADKQDRAGRADLGTAKTFYAASIFFEILNQFGEIQPDLEQKQKYAVWKAADIRKAMKEGRKPQPGPPAGDEDPLPSTTPIGSVDLGQSKINPITHPDSEPGPSSHFHDDIDFHDDKLNTQHSMSFPPSSPSYPTSHDFHPPPPRSENSNHSPPPNMPEPYSPPPNRPDLYSPPPNRPEPYSPPPNRPEIPTYSPQYHQPPFPQEPQQHFPQNYPNFQSYPSFSESSLPTAPSHYPSYYQGSDAPSYTASPPPATDYPSTEAHYNPRSRNGATVPDTPLPPTPAAAPIFEYDSNYQPPAEKIAEAHKAARFAVGALAFDDVPVAVDFLRKSLELLTRPSAGH